MTEPADDPLDSGLHELVRSNERVDANARDLSGKMNAALALIRRWAERTPSEPPLRPDAAE